MAVQRITDSGGKVLLDYMHVPDVGHFTSALDYSGAPFVLWQQDTDPYAADRVMGWSEINTYDGQRTDAFYASLFPYSRQEHVRQEGDDADYTRWFVGDRPVCERRELTRAWSDLPAQWLTYFKVADCEATATEIERHGGRIRKPVWVTSHGKACLATDLDGAWFGISESTPPPSQPQ